MAELALATHCPYDGTLVACGGSYADEQLVGSCGCCGETVTMQNYQRVAGPEIAADVVTPPQSSVAEPEPSLLQRAENAVEQILEVMETEHAGS